MSIKYQFEPPLRFFLANFLELWYLWGKQKNKIMATIQKNITKKKTLADFTLSKFDQMMIHVPNVFKKSFKTHDIKNRKAFLFPILLFWFLANRKGKQEIKTNKGSRPHFRRFETFEFSQNNVAIGLDHEEKSHEVDFFIERDGWRILEISSWPKAEECQIFCALDTNPREQDNFGNPNYRGKNGLPILCKVDGDIIAFLVEVLHHYQLLKDDKVFKLPKIQKKPQLAAKY